MGKVTALDAFTPVLADLLYGVDDPGGTPASKKMTITSLRDLIQAALTQITLSSDVILIRDAADTLALKRSTNAQSFLVYNTDDGVGNYDRGYIRFVSDFLEIGTEEGGTGTDRNITFKFGSAHKLQIRTDGIRCLDHLFWGTADKDIGADGTGRPRSLYLDGFIHTQDAGELTIDAGVITVTGSYHTVDTESDASDDALDTINGGVDGAILVLQAENTTRTINVTRAGNIHTSSDPVALADTESTITLLFSGALSAWVETSKSTNT